MKNPDLQQMQSAFKGYLFSGVNQLELASSVASANNIDSILRLDVYRNAYYVRLQEALAHDFPALLAVMGDELFGRDMAVYLQAYPSTDPSIRYIGQYLSRWFIQNNKPELADLARLEWAVLKAFDASNAVSLTGEYLQSVLPEDWDQLRFTLNPSVTLLDVDSNVLKIWKAYNKKEPLPVVQSNNPASLIIFRSHNGPVAQSIPQPHHTLFEALAENMAFGMACENLARLEPNKDVPHIAAQGLMQALSNGWLIHL